MIRGQDPKKSMDIGMNSISIIGISVIRRWSIYTKSRKLTDDQIRNYLKDLSRGIIGIAENIKNEPELEIAPRVFISINQPDKTLEYKGHFYKMPSKLQYQYQYQYL